MEFRRMVSREIHLGSYFFLYRALDSINYTHGDAFAHYIKYMNIYFTAPRLSHIIKLYFVGTVQYRRILK